MTAQRLNYVLIAVIIILFGLKCGKGHEQPSSSVSTPDVKAIAKSLDVKPNAIKSVVAFNTTSKGSLKAKRDTVVVFRDRWTKIEVANSGTDSLEAKYDIRDSLQVTTYEKRKWILSPSKTFIDIKHSNPNVQTDGVRNYELPIKQKKWSLGVGISYGFDGKQFKPAVGITLSKTLIRF